MIRSRLLVLAAGAALAAAPAAAQTRPAPEALAYRIPGYALDRLDPRPARPDSLRPPDDWLGRDKVLHAGASFLLTLSGQYVYTDKANLSSGTALPLSAATALAIGVAKEIVDSRRAVGPHFSLRDLAADAFGVALGALVTRL